MPAVSWPMATELTTKTPSQGLLQACNEGFGSCSSTDSTTHFAHKKRGRLLNCERLIAGNLIAGNLPIAGNLNCTFAIDLLAQLLVGATRLLVLGDSEHPGQTQEHERDKGQASSP